MAVLRPREGGLRRGEIFWLRLTTASAQCLHLSERFFHCRLGVFESGLKFIFVEVELELGLKEKGLGLGLKLETAKLGLI